MPLTLHELKGQHPPWVLQPRNVEEAHHVANQTKTQHLWKERTKFNKLSHQFE
jgi:hypothetical protein